ncbi:MAG TPA: HAD-IA family hydrolase [Gaiellaceae bacterium]|nr:HAD-IA family hydrolase [Gaiellaceae bacterium]
MRFPHVLFDLDGTLIDSGSIILASFRHATRTVLEREIPDAELAALVGGSNIHDQMRAIDELQADELVRVYREHNEPLHDELEAFEGIEHVLDSLKREGRTLAIVTAKRRKTVDLAFAVLPLERYFDVVVTADTTERHKPHPDPVLAALEGLGTDPSAAAFVGDSPFDVEAGRAAGVFTVAVAWGNIHPVENLAAADVLVESPAQLLDVL